MTRCSRSQLSKKSNNLRQGNSIKSNIGILFALALGPVPSTATDIPCPAPDPPDGFAEREAPQEIYSVDHASTDGESEYSIFIDLEYGDFSLEAVVLAYISGDKILLLTSVDPLRLETQAVVSIVVDPSISEDIRLSWSYTESGKMCPDTIMFEYRLSEERAN